MPLTLTIRNATQLDNGSPLSLVLDRRGALIGRAATADWCLPDPTLHISSRHCEIRYAGDRYELIDHSTNGTFLFGQGARLAGPHTINQGDAFVIGPFEITAALDDAAAAAAASLNAAPPAEEWRGWAAAAGSSSAPPASASAWDAPPPSSAISGAGPMSQNWAAPSAAPVAPPSSGGWGAPAPAAAPPPAPSGWGAPAAPEPSSAASAWGAAAPSPASEPVNSVWNSAPPPPATPASEWSAPTGAPPPPPSGNDIWGQFAASNVVDWARGGFGTPSPPSPPIAAPSPPIATSAPPPAATSLEPAAAPPAQPAIAPAGPGGGLAALTAAAGVDAGKLRQTEAETLAQAGNLLRRLVSGLVVMLEARARAKSQMGAQSTSLEFDGNNPLKFARTPEQALLQLLNPQDRGFMSAERAVEDAYKDLQAHQMATLKAMQGALRATLDRFSPTAIRQRAEQGGLLSRILPGAKDAALWKAYEKEFGGVAHGSDEAFMDMFAKEFRRAYDEIASKR